MSSDAVGNTKSLVLRFKILGFVLPSLGAALRAATQLVLSLGIPSIRSGPDQAIFFAYWFKFRLHFPACEEIPALYILSGDPTTALFFFYARCDDAVQVRPLRSGRGGLFVLAGGPGCAVAEHASEKMAMLAQLSRGNLGAILEPSSGKFKGV